MIGHYTTGAERTSDSGPVFNRHAFRGLGAHMGDEAVDNADTADEMPAKVTGNAPSSPPIGPPTGPPTGPPSGPPTGPPSGPPAGPPGRSGSRAMFGGTTSSPSGGPPPAPPTAPLCAQSMGIGSSVVI